jgi:high-affinity Fe2+/Pb2+ permease
MKAVAEPSSTPTSTVRWIMLSVLAWGLLLALGTYLFGGSQPLLRAAIVAGCTLAFLAFWLAALAMRQRRIKRDAGT